MTFHIVAVLALWFVVSILPMSYWRADNMRKQVCYWCRWHRFCDHVQDKGGAAWSDWRAYWSTTAEYRQCRRCGVEQRRPVPGAWV